MGEGAERVEVGEPLGGSHGDSCGEGASPIAWRGVGAKLQPPRPPLQLRRRYWYKGYAEIAQYEGNVAADVVGLLAALPLALHLDHCTS